MVRRIAIARVLSTLVGVLLTINAANLWATDNLPVVLDDSVPSWTLPPNPPSWARNKEGVAVRTSPDESLNGQASTRVVNNNSTDWALNIPETIDVEQGQIFELTCKLKNVGKSYCRSGVILYDADGEQLSWSYGGRDIYPSENWQTIVSKFIIPDGVVKIEPRLIGQDVTDVYIAKYEIKRLGALKFRPLEGTTVAENQFLRVVFQNRDASFSIQDVRTGRVWRQTTSGRSYLATAVEPIDRGARFQLVDARSLFAITAQVQLEKDAPEIVVTLSADPEAQQTFGLDYPLPFASVPTDRVALPLNEGISFPTTEEAIHASELYTYGGHGLCMAFWAIVDDKLDAAQSDGLMGIIETPDDAEVDTELRDANSDTDDKEDSEKSVKTLAVGSRWLPSTHKFRYDRKLRLIAFDKGGYVAACKRYREYAKQIGLLVTFDEKARKNPELAKGLDLLVGAANIWCWDAGGAEMVPILQDAGFDRILWCAGGNSDEIKLLNEKEGVLTSRYDIYQDIMNPARYDELPGVHSDWIPEAWPKDIVWDSPDGKWTKGWEVDAKDATKPRIACGVLCDLKAVQYAEKRIEKELAKKPYQARYIDTTLASAWRECWNPDHPMTRTDSKNARMELLELIGKRFDLVCGSETGIDAAVPYCDFFEGMMSIGPFRCPESGRYTDRIWDEVPELVEKYQLGEKYRLPLFELVYHGCVVSYWFWGDHNDKFPSLWGKRDLFNVLYGVPPMYGFKRDFFEANRERFEASYKVAEPVSRLTGRAEMTDHQILTPDRTVQKSVFANGVETIVNFGSKEYRCEDGVVVAPESFRVIDGRRAQD